MNTWLLRSTSFVLTASLLLPAVQAHAQTALQPAVKPVSATTGDNVSMAAASKAKLSKEAALAIAQKMVPTNGLTLANVSFRSADPWRSFPEWSFNWVKKAGNNDEVQLSYSVSVHADTGELTGYSRYEPGASNLPYAKRISYADAKAQAEQFLEKFNAGKAKQTRLYMRDLPEPKTPLNSDVNFSFRFVRLEDGILFPDNGIDITVNGSGTVISYSLNWDAVDFQKPAATLSIEEAKRRLQEQTQARLSYIIPWEAQGDERNKPILAYASPFTFFLDAGTGTALSPSLTPLRPYNEPSPASPKPLGARHTGKEMTQDEAVKSVESAVNLAGFELRSANYNESDYRGNRPVWNLDYESKDKGSGGYIFVSIDAANGDIYSFHKEQRIASKEQKTSANTQDPEAWRDRAAERIRSLTPTLASHLYWDDASINLADSGNADRYSVRFQRYVGGIAAASGSASLTFDAKTGELLSYNADFGSETYPAKPAKHLPATDALEAWWKEAEVEAVYTLVPLSPQDKQKMQQPSFVPKRTAKLVYRASITPYEQPYFYDAITGEWRSQSSGKTINLHRAVPSDLKGHPAEKELMVMYEYDALSLIDGKIMPEKEITRGEMIEMLMISLNQGRFYPMYSADRKASFSDVANGSRYFSAVEAAVDRGLLDKNGSKLNPDEPIDREELADMIVRALGYSKLADYPGMFQTRLTDIASTKHRVSIIIATTLDIIPSDKQQYRPQAKVSRADAAISFIRFLEKRSEQNTQPILYRSKE